MYHALIVEDDIDLAVITKAHLVKAGYAADNAYRCDEALALVSQNQYDLILLDELLPDSSGDKLCRIIRDNCDCPIIFMSCLDDSDTIIEALRSGGDDYMVKPVNYNELIARAEAIIRRANERKHIASSIQVFKSFSIDTLHRRLIRNDEQLELPSTEYSILLYMINHPNTLLLYDELYRAVWSCNSVGDVRTVMVHISNLRKKVDPNKIGIITTVRGGGYIFADL
ncbi:MAG: response regulator transcription factor [Oscillospiraceae bacterium]